MANNKQVYPGNVGTPFTIATDEIAGVDFQLFKLVAGAEDAVERIEGSAAFGLEVDVTRAPASDWTTDTIAAAIAHNAIMEGRTALTVKWAKATVAASTTDAALVSAVASKSIKVIGAGWTGTSDTDVTFNSKPAGAGTAVSATFKKGFAFAWAPTGLWAPTTAGEGLTVTTGAGSTQGIQIAYLEVS